MWQVIRLGLLLRHIPHTAKVGSTSFPRERFRTEIDPIADEKLSENYKIPDDPDDAGIYLMRT